MKPRPHESRRRSRSTTPFALAVLQNDFRDRRFSANLGAGFARRIGNRVRNRAGAAARQVPTIETRRRSRPCNDAAARKPCPASARRETCR